MNTPVDLSILTIEEIKKLPAGIYYAKTEAGESAIVKVSASEPTVKVEAVRDDLSVHIHEYFSDGRVRESIRPRDSI